MDLTNIAYSLGDLFGGALQVVTNILNFLIDVLPNPDPFPGMIEEISWVNGNVWSMGFYWMDTIFDMNFLVQILLFYAGVMAISALFAFIWMLVRSLP